ncbi:MAG: hypothetical protein IT168_25425 [Bryobacterales bacterium]|nr:hypothetical protein [Bryobacterales bacterium]
MMFRGAYHQAIVEEHGALCRFRAMAFSGLLLVMLLLVVTFCLAVLWWMA